MCRSVVAAMVLSAVPSAAAQSDPWPPLTRPPAAVGGGADDAAVICGVEDYAYLPDVAGANLNARDWYLYLAKTRKVRPDRIRRLSSGECSKETLLEATREAAQRVRRGGTLWFVFMSPCSPGAAGGEWSYSSGSRRRPQIGTRSSSIASNGSRRTRWSPPAVVNNIQRSPSSLSTSTVSASGSTSHRCLTPARA